jgi:Holliday junction DNA helicase RuvB
MEEFRMDIVIGQGPAARSIRLDLPRFTLIGATTRPGLITAPLRSRFGIVEHLEYYSLEELAEGIRRDARLLGVGITEEAALEIARRSRGTMRIAKRLFRRVRDFAQVAKEETITRERALLALEALGLDELGLERRDREILEVLILRFGGGPVGLSTLATALSEDPGTLEEVYEPYLIQQGLLKRTPRGRMATEKAYRHLGFPPPVEPLLEP